MPVKKLKEFLDSHRVKYVSIIHSRAYTAQEIAARRYRRGIAFNAGSHTELIKLAYADFERLVSPEVVDF